MGSRHARVPAGVHCHLDRRGNRHSHWRHVNTGDPTRIDLLLSTAGHYDFGIFQDPFNHFRTEQFYAPHDRVPFAYPAASGVILAFF